VVIWFEICLIWVEMFMNFLLNVVDIVGVVEVVEGCVVVVDNIFVMFVV